MAWKCYVVTPTRYAAQHLRRFTWQGGIKCRKYYDLGHNAMTRLSEVVMPRGFQVQTSDTFSHTHPNWPKNCACGYRFQETDPWQLHLARIYEGVRDGVPIRGVMADLPPGAMYTVEPSEALSVVCRGVPGPDGLHLFLKLPGSRVWEVTAHRHGKLPNIDINQPLKFSDYEGTIADGVISDDALFRDYDQCGRLIG